LQNIEYCSVMKRSHLKSKSEILEDSVKLLHDNNYYPGVGHAAYYCCFQLMKDICLIKINITEQELESFVSQSKSGTHEYILNEIVKYVAEHNREDSRTLRSKVPQLKKFRVKADYKDEDFNFDDSRVSISLSNEILKILKKY